MALSAVAVSVVVLLFTDRSAGAWGMAAEIVGALVVGVVVKLGWQKWRRT